MSPHEAGDQSTSREPGVHRTAGVNYIHHMNGWFARIYEDTRLHSSHIALYMALFQFWNLHRFQSPFTVFREELMKLSKIGSANTYTRCIKELAAWGYIKYHPSFNPMIGSKVELFTFDKGTGKGSDEGSVRVLRPINKQEKQTKHTNSHVNQIKNFDEPL